MHDSAGITTFPPEVGELRLLEDLQVDGCPLVSPYDMLYRKDPLLVIAIHDTQLQSLDISETGLEEVPSQVLKLTALTSLNMAKNALKVRCACFPCNVVSNPVYNCSLRD